MNFFNFEQEQHFRSLWNSVAIVRTIPYTLFTFGESDLPYYLIVEAERPREPVTVSQGSVKITRPLIVTPHQGEPELRNFFEDERFSGMFSLLMARSAAFKHLRIENQSRQSELVSDSVDEIVARLKTKLDNEEEDRVAILTAPAGLGPLAVLRYTTERILESAPGNLQELKERGLLPEF
ncbi:hypothetical protein [Planctomicrobium sp. SH664]|uniref:hypothetical protein n=1 Tax=Planctomicrobium sp. SH664 TaxID=3448125 RepID=UPI003F5C4327